MLVCQLKNRWKLIFLFLNENLLFLSITLLKFDRANFVFLKNNAKNGVQFGF